MFSVTTWNVEWAQPGSARGQRVASVLEGSGDVLVVTECELGLLPQGHVVDGGDDWGYVTDRPERRKVALWSRTPWTDVDTEGSPFFPRGRFVAATTETADGPVRVVGVCVPWSGAHVRTGRRDRRAWEDHATFLEHLGPVLQAQPRPLVVAGDLNQRIPRFRQPEHVFDLLMTALDGLYVPSAGDTGAGQLIDHVAISDELRVHATGLVPARNEEGRLSDHTGVGFVLGID